MGTQEDLGRALYEALSNESTDPTENPDIAPLNKLTALAGPLVTYLSGGSSGSFSGDATSLQGVSIADTSPTDGYSLVYSGGDNEWQPVLVDGGGGSGTDTLDDVCDRGAITEQTIACLGVDARDGQITNVFDPVNDQDAATKKYVDGFNNPQTSYLTSNVDITSSSVLYGNGTDTGLSVTISAGEWCVTYTTAVSLTPGYGADSGLVSLWVEDGSAIVGYSSQVYTGTDQIGNIVHTFVVSVPAVATTLTLYGARNAPTTDTASLLGAPATSVAFRSNLIALRVG